MILVLDDDQARLDAFRAHWGNHILSCVKTAKQAIELLETFKFDMVFLDHDLGGEIFVSSSSENTGAAVARWLEDPINERSRPRVLVIHTLNPVGRKYMAQALPWATVCADGAWNHTPKELPAHLIPAIQVAGL